MTYKLQTSGRKINRMKNKNKTNPLRRRKQYKNKVGHGKITK
jgi:hypothetical protein